jgi:GDP-mannose 6-dehydrogenase
MRISVFGLGYVGCVTAACLAHDGHQVIGIEINPTKVELLRSGYSPIIEPGLEELVKEGINSGNLKVSTESQDNIQESDISLICVGTPSKDNGSLNTQFVENVCSDIGLLLSSKRRYHVVVVRSTVLPGTVEEKLIPILEEKSGLRAGIDFGVCMNPEFLREGSAINDFYHPGQVVIGELDTRSGDIVAKIYDAVESPLTRTTIRTAEMVKYACNTFHAIKVVFANEIGNLCKAQGIDGQKVMEIFIKDRQLNISDNYLRPGFAFGGSCLPKDLRAILHRSKELDIDSMLLTSVIASNQKQIEKAIQLVEKSGCKKIGILGLSFKPDTDDLRESPIITLAETLLGRGYQIHIFDEKLQLSKLVGQNKIFLERELPHIASLLAPNIEQLVSQSEVIVIANGSKTFQRVTELIVDGQMMIDLVGIAKNDGKSPQMNYQGICW